LLTAFEAPGEREEASMNIFTRARGTLSACLILTATMVSGAQAAELQVLAGAGIRAPLNEIAAQFEKATGHKVIIRYGTAPELMKMATTGGPFDLGVFPADVFKDEATRAQFTSQSMPEVARIGIGVAVRAGAPKPDISTPEALKQVLLKSRSIASIPASATGAYLATVYAQLDIVEEVKTRMKAQREPQQIAVAVDSGEAELAVFILNILADPRLDVVGPLPAELQRETVYKAGVSAGARDPVAAMALIAYLMSPDGATVIKAKGMAPG
jgi:molybdate transport system substrate-binding protein